MRRAVIVRVRLAKIGAGGGGGGFAVHGYPDVPAYPASHGCARIPLWIATTVYTQMPPGSTVYLYA